MQCRVAATLGLLLLAIPLEAATLLHRGSEPPSQPWHPHLARRRQADGSVVLARRHEAKPAQEGDAALSLLQLGEQDSGRPQPCNCPEGQPQPPAGNAFTQQAAAASWGQAQAAGYGQQQPPAAYGQAGIGGPEAAAFVQPAQQGQAAMLGSGSPQQEMRQLAMQGQQMMQQMKMMEQRIEQVSAAEQAMRSQAPMMAAPPMQPMAYQGPVPQPQMMAAQMGGPQAWPAQGQVPMQMPAQMPMQMAWGQVPMQQMAPPAQGPWMMSVPQQVPFRSPYQAVPYQMEMR